jgi:putative cell wall-binding protein
MAANLSKRMFPWGTDTVVITRGDVFTDALSGGALASLEGAPLLFSDFASQSLPVPVQNEIKRLKSEEAIILGGTDSVSSRVVSQLKAIGVTDVERIGGANRFAVSANVANHVFTRVQALSPNQRPDTVIIASGLVFPDALSASSPSGQLLLPILQVTKNTIPTEILKFIQNQKDVKHFIIVGGPGTVSPAVESRLRIIAEGRKGAVERISGVNRFEVSAKVGEYFGLDSELFVFASGLVFPDALAGGPFAASIHSSLLLTPPDALDPHVATHLKNVQGRLGFYVLGGPDSVSPNVAGQLKNMTKPR